MILKILNKIKTKLDYTLQWSLISLMAIMVIDVSLQVFTRKVLGFSLNWTEELARYILIWIGLLGSSYALSKKAHLGIDALTSKFSVKIQSYISIFSYILVGLFSIFVLIIGGWKLASLTFDTNQISAALQWKIGYIYLALPISGIFNIIYCIFLILDDLGKSQSQDLYIKTAIIE